MYGFEVFGHSGRGERPDWQGAWDMMRSGAKTAVKHLVEAPGQLLKISAKNFAYEPSSIDKLGAVSLAGVEMPKPHTPRHQAELDALDQHLLATADHYEDMIALIDDSRTKR